eukprot:6924155-Pyramimonas_sp.AAC.1
MLAPFLTVKAQGGRNRPRGPWALAVAIRNATLRRRTQGSVDFVMLNIAGGDSPISPMGVA